MTYKDYLGVLPLNAEIACNSSANYFYEILEANTAYLLIFIPFQRTPKTITKVFELYDFVLKNLVHEIKPVIITDSIPEGYNDRNIILDKENNLFSHFEVNNKPKLIVINKAHEICRGINKYKDLSNKLLNILM